MFHQFGCWLILRFISMLHIIYNEKYVHEVAAKWNICAWLEIIHRTNSTTECGPYYYYWKRWYAKQIKNRSFRLFILIIYKCITPIKSYNYLIIYQKWSKTYFRSYFLVWTTTISLLPTHNYYNKMCMPENIFTQMSKHNHCFNYTENI